VLNLKPQLWLLVALFYITWATYIVDSHLITVITNILFYGVIVNILEAGNFKKLILSLFLLKLKILLICTILLLLLKRWFPICTIIMLLITMLYLYYFGFCFNLIKILRSYFMLIFFFLFHLLHNIFYIILFFSVMHRLTFSFLISYLSLLL